MVPLLVSKPPVKDYKKRQQSNCSSQRLQHQPKTLVVSEIFMTPHHHGWRKGGRKDSPCASLSSRYFPPSNSIDTPKRSLAYKTAKKLQPPLIVQKANSFSNMYPPSMQLRRANLSLSSKAKGPKLTCNGDTDQDSMSDQSLNETYAGS